MIYQIGKLIIGDNWKDMRSWWGQYVKKKKKWLAGVLTYNSEERNLYFFEGRYKDEQKKIVFNIDTTHFELVKRGTMSYVFLIYIKDKDNNVYLFNSDTSFYSRSQNDYVYGQGKQIVYNKVIVNIIDHLKSN